MSKSRVELSVKGVAVPVTPIYGENIKLKINRENGQAYYRESLEGTFKFVKADFDAIKGWPANTMFTLKYWLGDRLIGSGYFHKEECTFDEDNRICDVKITTTDRYTKILEGLDNTYNMVKLAPKRKNLTLMRRPALQVYVLGSDKLSYIYGNQRFELDCERIELDKEDDLRNKMHFAKIPVRSWVLKNFAGTEITFYATAFEQDNGKWRIEFRNAYDTTFVNYFVKDIDLNNVVEEYPVYNERGQIESGAIFYAGARGHIESITEMEGLTLRTDPTAYALNNGHIEYIYARWISPVSKAGTVDLFEIPIEGDITERNLNYTYCAPADASVLPDLNVSKYMDVSYEVQEKPTEFGTNKWGDYFVAPRPIKEQDGSDAVENILPIAWDAWLPGSYWFHSPCYEQFWILADRAMATEHTLKDAFDLIDCISVLLKEIDPTIRFGNSEAYSEFLTSVAPADAWKATYPHFLRSLGKSLYITPSTNVKETQYSQAAQRGDITLGQIFNMLKNCFQCYWWIDDENRLRIEHIAAVKNGGGYLSEQRNIAYDLIYMKSLPTNKTWDFGLNTTSMKEGAISRYEFAWNDETTEQFNGYAIDLDHVTKGNTESITVTNFNSDLDYMMLNPEGVSNDCFAVIAASADGTVGIDIVGDREFNFGPHHGMQNGLLSFLSLERTYYVYDMSSAVGVVRTPAIYMSGVWDETGSVIFAKGIRAGRKQTLKFPCDADIIRTLGLIRTDLGDGVISSVDLTANTGFATIEVDITEPIDISNFITAWEEQEPGQKCMLHVRNRSRVGLTVDYAIVVNDIVDYFTHTFVASSDSTQQAQDYRKYAIVVKAVRDAGESPAYEPLFNNGIVDIRLLPSGSLKAVSVTNNSVLPITVKYSAIVDGNRLSDRELHLAPGQEDHNTAYFGQSIKFLLLGLEY